MVQLNLYKIQYNSAWEELKVVPLEIKKISFDIKNDVGENFAGYTISKIFLLKTKFIDSKYPRKLQSF